TWGYTRIQGRARERRPSRGPPTIRRVLKAAGLPPVPAAADLVADILEGALRRLRCRRFLHDRSLDVARVGYFFNGVRHRSGVPSRADPRVHAPSVAGR